MKRFAVFFKERRVARVIVEAEDRYEAFEIGRKMALAGEIPEDVIRSRGFKPVATLAAEQREEECA